MRVLLHKMAPKRKREQSLERKIKRPATNADATPNSVFVNLMHDLSSRPQLESERPADHELLETIGELDTTSPLLDPLSGGLFRNMFAPHRGGVTHAARLHTLNLEDLDMQLAGRSESFRREHLDRMSARFRRATKPAPQVMLISAQPIRMTHDRFRLEPLVISARSKSGSKSAESVTAKQRRLLGKYH